MACSTLAHVVTRVRVEQEWAQEMEEKDADEEQLRVQLTAHILASNHGPKTGAFQQAEEITEVDGVEYSCESTKEAVPPADPKPYYCQVGV